MYKTENNCAGRDAPFYIRGRAREFFNFLLVLLVVVKYHTYYASPWYVFCHGIDIMIWSHQSGKNYLKKNVAGGETIFS